MQEITVKIIQISINHDIDLHIDSCLHSQAYYHNSGQTGLTSLQYVATILITMHCPKIYHHDSVVSVILTPTSSQLSNLKT